MRGLGHREVEGGGGCVPQHPGRSPTLRTQPSGIGAQEIMRPGTAPPTRSPGGGASLERRGLHGAEIRRANGGENSAEQQPTERQFVRHISLRKTPACCRRLIYQVP